MGLRNRSTYKEERCFFVTSSFNKMIKFLNDDDNINIIISSLKFVNNKYNAHFLAYVLMPDHIHFVIFFEKENRLSDYMRDFKKFTSGEIRRNIDNKNLGLDDLEYNVREQKFKVWMDRFDDVLISSKSICETKMNYIHLNPVKENLCLFPEDYKYSSAKYYDKSVQDELKILDYREVFG